MDSGWCLFNLVSLKPVICILLEFVCNIIDSWSNSLLSPWIFRCPVLKTFPLRPRLNVSQKFSGLASFAKSCLFSLARDLMEELTITTEAWTKLHCKEFEVSCTLWVKDEISSEVNPSFSFTPKVPLCVRVKLSLVHLVELYAVSNCSSLFCKREFCLGLHKHSHESQLEQIFWNKENLFWINILKTWICLV